MLITKSVSFGFAALACKASARAIPDSLQDVTTQPAMLMKYKTVHANV